MSGEPSLTFALGLELKLLKLLSRIKFIFKQFIYFFLIIKDQSYIRIQNICFKIINQGIPTYQLVYNTIYFKYQIRLNDGNEPMYYLTHLSFNVVNLLFFKKLVGGLYILESAFDAENISIADFF